MNDIPGVQKRLDDLDAHIAHQDSTIEDLNEVSIEQWKEIKTLTEKITRLEAKIQAAQEATETVSTPEPPPPHY